VFYLISKLNLQVTIYIYNLSVVFGLQ